MLGPVEAWSRGSPLDLGPRKQRFTLAILALQVNQPVPVDRLVDLIWSCAPPRTARHAIQVCVSRLRALLAGAEPDGEGVRILTRGATYTLRGDPMCIDAYRFRGLVAGARSETSDAGRAEKLRQALALWHGPPLADVVTPAVDSLCRGLEEARLVAAEECLDAELRLGRHGAVVDQLVELVAQHPYHQRVVALLMLALYRDGRAPEALRTYRLTRSRLVAEFGLDPDAQLQRLEGAILRADPWLDPPQPAPVPARGPASQQRQERLTPILDRPPLPVLRLR